MLISIGNPRSISNSTWRSIRPTEELLNILENKYKFEG